MAGILHDEFVARFNPAAMVGRPIGVPTSIPAAHRATVAASEALRAEHRQRTQGKSESPRQSGRTTLADLQNRLEASIVQSQRKPDSDRWKYAIHEAGHFVTLAAVGESKRLCCLEIPEGDRPGAAGVIEIVGLAAMPPAKAVPFLCGGGAAVEEFGLTLCPETNASDNAMIETAIKGRSKAEQNRFRTHGRAMARIYVRKHRDVVERVAALLSHHGHIRPADVAHFIDEIKNPPAPVERVAARAPTTSAQPTHAAAWNYFQQAKRREDLVFELVSRGHSWGDAAEIVCLNH